ncbi:acetyltransferase [Atopobiaceae bacterium P1]|uniref:Acetyltransferase n=1 Tax=Leptogranulimonas caecicola TaxID=2894156 RepID=A0AAU9CLK0_9ACTN|nr:sugar O-acetyltransferase [Leptogranulimonas caecicola]BCV18044.1 acetyltransferase [Atopobiaceae bacterium P1]BDC90451.1 acetyltransferase [Leptogranulimonas caecicola]
MAALPPQDPTCWYDANFDEELVEVRHQAEHTCWLINQLDPQDAEKHQQLLGELFGSLGVGVEVLAPVMVDYGTNVSLGDGCFVNHNAYFMDGAPIVIGAHVFVGPDCGFYTANHPLLASERNQGWEQARPITIQDNVWIGAKVSILPGVTIGEGAVVGAGSVVTKDVPPHTLAAGNPCRPLRLITAQDTIGKE